MARKAIVLTERYVASMVLSGVGDAMGFKSGEWEFENDGEFIHEQCSRLGGIKQLKIKCKFFAFISKRTAKEGFVI